MAELNPDQPRDDEPAIEEVGRWASECLKVADRAVAQVMLDGMWDIAKLGEPDVATMTLVAAGFISRTLAMIEDLGVPQITQFRIIAALVASITAKQAEFDRERGGHA
jgi:hypothetical protein